MAWDETLETARQRVTEEYFVADGQQRGLYLLKDKARAVKIDALDRVAEIEARIEREACDIVYMEQFDNIGKKAAEKKPLRYPTADEKKKLRLTLRYSSEKWSAEWREVNAIFHDAVQALENAEEAITCNEVQIQKCHHVLDGITAELQKRATDETRRLLNENMKAMSESTIMLQGLQALMQSVSVMPGLQTLMSNSDMVNAEGN